MFGHIFIYNLKTLWRSKESVFWTLLFPITLAVLFNFAFGNINSADDFNVINIAVAQTDEFKPGAPLFSALSSVSNIDGVPGEKDLFSVIKTSRTDAENLIKTNEITGFLYYDGEIRLLVSGSGFNQTVTKLFFDEYLKTESTVSNIVEINPQTADSIHQIIGSREEFLKQVPISSSNPDTTVIYFYALLAMTCLYAAMNGLQEVIKIQANLSAKAARVCLAPVHKFRLFLYNISAAAIYQLVVIFAVLAFMVFVIGVDFGNKIGLIILTAIIGCFTGLFFGTFVGAVVKAGEGIKFGIVLGGSMLSCFLSGLMMVNMKYIVSRDVPFIGYISPANLITDAFYSLYYYDGLIRFYMSISILSLITAVFCISTCLVLRRQKYASI